MKRAREDDGGLTSTSPGNNVTKKSGQARTRDQKSRGGAGGEAVAAGGDVAPSTSALDVLLAWGKQRGSRGLERVKCRHFDGMGAGVEAVADIPSGKESDVIALPRGLLITRESAMVAAPVAEAAALPDCASRKTLESASDAELIVLQLMYETMRGEASPWAPYIAAMPENVPCAACTAEADVARFLDGTRLGLEARRAAAAREESYDRLLSKGLCVSAPQQFPALRYTRGAHRRAHTLFWSRAIRVPARARRRDATVTEMVSAMVPLVDALNHRPGALTWWADDAGRPVEAFAVDDGRQAPSRSLDALDAGPPRTAQTAGTVEGQDELLHLKTGRLIRKGEQVFLNYGAKSNGDLLLRFGFVLPKNRVETVAMVLRGRDGGGAGSVALEIDVGADTAGAVERSFLLSSEGLPVGLLDACREAHTTRVPEAGAAHGVAHVYGEKHATDVGDFESWLARQQEGTTQWRASDVEIGTPLSVASERRTLTWLKRELGRAATTMEACGCRPEDAADAEFARLCVEYRTGQAAVLTATEDIIERLLGCLPLVDDAA